MFMNKTVTMKIIFTSLVALSIAGPSGASHCSGPGGITPTAVVVSGTTLILPGRIIGGETDVFSFDAVAGCTYKASFLPADGGSSVGNTSGSGSSNTPYVKVRKLWVL
jgi:hypothetical protein